MAESLERGRSPHRLTQIVCDARAKHGGRCRARPLPGRRRCRLHGGTSPGGYRGGSTKPANAAYRRKLAIFRQLGIPWYGGRPRKPQKVRTLVDEAKDQIAQDVALLSEATGMMPDGSAGQELGRVALKGLSRLEQIIDLPLDESDPKQMRLIGDMALGCCKLFQRAAEGAFKAQQGHTLVALLEALKKAQEGKG